MDQKIGRFDIPVNNIFLMDFAEPVADLFEDLSDLGLAKTASLTCHIRFQILLAIFQEEIEMILSP